MISFRVSEDEYAGLKTLCVNRGARSVSDMARDAVNRLIATPAWPNNQLETAVQVLQGRIEALDSEVKRLGMAVGGQVSTRVAAGNGNGDM